MDPFTDRIDDQILAGSFDLANLGARLLRQRITAVQDICRDVLKTPFDFFRERIDRARSGKKGFLPESPGVEGMVVQAAAVHGVDALSGPAEGGRQGGERGEKNRARHRPRMGAAGPAGVLKSMERLFQRMLRNGRMNRFALSQRAGGGVRSAQSLLSSPRQGGFRYRDVGHPGGDRRSPERERGEGQGAGRGPARLIQNQSRWKTSFSRSARGGRAGGYRRDDGVRRGATDPRPEGNRCAPTVRKPDGRMLNLALVRNIVEIQETYARSAILLPESPGRKFGYIFLPGFTMTSTAIMAGIQPRTFEKNWKIETAAGGRYHPRPPEQRRRSLDDAVNMSGLFIENGPISRSGTGVPEFGSIRIRTRISFFRGPLVVLVNTLSASRVGDRRRCIAGLWPGCGHRRQPYVRERDGPDDDRP